MLSGKPLLILQSLGWTSPVSYIVVKFYFFSLVFPQYWTVEGRNPFLIFVSTHLVQGLLHRLHLWTRVSIWIQHWISLYLRLSEVEATGIWLKIPVDKKKCPVSFPGSTQSPWLISFNSLVTRFNLQSCPRVLGAVLQELIWFSVRVSCAGGGRFWNVWNITILHPLEIVSLVCVR